MEDALGAPKIGEDTVSQSQRQRRTRAAFVMRKTTLILVVVCVTVLGLLIAGHVLYRHFRGKREKKRIMEACGGAADAANSIFVTLVSYQDPVGAARTMDSLFTNAHCPLRVYVGLCEFYDDDATTTTASAAYKDVCTQNASAFTLTDHIRVLRVPSHESKGAFTAREHIERYLFRSEAYVLSLGCPARVAKGWDKYLIDTLAGAALAEGGDPGSRVVLSSRPEALPRNPNAPGPSLEQPGTFLAATSATPVPQFAGFKLRKVSLDAVVPAIAWSAALSFSTGKRVTDVPYPRDVVFCEDAQDFVMTLALKQHGYRLFHPAAQVALCAWGSAQPELQALDLEQDQQCRQRLLRAASTLPVYRATVKAMGVAADMAQVTARGRMGLTPTPGSEELEAKLGSTGEYLSLLSRIDLHTNAH